MQQFSPAFLLVSICSVVVGLQGCSSPAVTTVELADAPVPVRLRTNPAIATRAAPVQLRITTPNADSIEIRSADGFERYSGKGASLQVSLPSTFGDSTPLARYAVRRNGHLFDVFKKPMYVTVCRNRNCREYYHELAVRLPEQNRRRVAVTAGWRTALSDRAVENSGRDLVSHDPPNHSVWNLQAEFATGTVTARLQGSFSSQARAAALDLARVIRSGGDGVGYGLAVHLGGNRGEWVPVAGSNLPSGSTTYHASVGPAVMLKGVTFTTQFGLFVDGGEMLQEMSTILSFNGGFTDVRYPLSLTMERRQALGDEPVIARRRDELQRLTLGIDVVPGVALELRMSSHQSAWPSALGGHQVSLDELSYTVGAQYTLGW